MTRSSGKRALTGAVSGRAARAVALAVLAATVAQNAAPGPRAARAPATAEDLARLKRENIRLTKLLELAKGKEFYLILDTRENTLTLMLRGATLQTWRVSEIEVGGPRVAFVHRELPDSWEGTIWTDGNLDPERKIDRFELNAPPPTPEGTEQEIPIPPTPEEAYPVPPRYHIRFKGGLSIEVNPPGARAESGFLGRLWTGIVQWWHDATEAVSIEPSDTVRLRLVLSEKDADSLYRALPPKTKLLILPPAS